MTNPIIDLFDKIVYAKTESEHSKLYAKLIKEVLKSDEDTIDEAIRHGHDIWRLMNQFKNMKH